MGILGTMKNALPNKSSGCAKTQRGGAASLTIGKLNAIVGCHPDSAPELRFVLCCRALPAVFRGMLSQSPSVIRVRLSLFAHGGSWRKTAAAKLRR